jgi:hypothetical protein
MTEMFIEKPKLIEVLETPTVIPNEKVKKPRKPMSDERKAQLREQLAKAREAKKAKKLESTQVGGHSVPEVEKPKPLKVVKIKKIERNTAPSIPLTILEEVDDMEDLKTQLAELKKSNKKHQRDLIAQAIDFEKQKQVGQNHIQKKNDEKVIKRKAKAKAAEAEDVMEEPKGAGFPELPNDYVPPAPPPPPQPAARYATYKKSIWTDLKQ